MPSKSRARFAGCWLKFSENRATAQINLNLSQIGQLGEEWNSAILIDVDNSLSKNVTTANAGNLIGNRMFYDNDYMVWLLTSRLVPTS
jgi:hypothetical protein